MTPPAGAAAPSATPADRTAAESATATRTAGKAAIFWAIGLFAVVTTAAYLAWLPKHRVAQAEALLDQVPIDLTPVLQRGDKGMEPVRLTNPVTGKPTPYIQFEAFIGKKSDQPDLAARRAFIALGDLCGTQPKLGMSVFRIGLNANIKTEWRRRLVANEMLIFVRDLRDLYPDDPELALTMDDIYQVALSANAEEFIQGSARRGADILSRFLAFPADAPETIKVIDFDAQRTAATGRLVYLEPLQYNGKPFKQPFFEQGRDCLLMLDTLKKESFTWDPITRRFLYSGVKLVPVQPEAPAGSPTTNPLQRLGVAGPETPLPAPVEPPTAAPAPADAPAAPPAP